MTRFAAIRNASIAAVGVIAAVSSSAGTAQAAPGPLPPVPSVDVQQYLGTWNQLAAIPQFFSLNCASDTQANYSLAADKTVIVKNTCRSFNGGPVNIEGRAKIVDSVTNAQLNVSFAQLPDGQFLYFGGPNYIIASLAPDYSVAIVGDPGRGSGFILARNPVVTQTEWVDLKHKVEALGYNSCFFLTTPHQGGYDRTVPLCTLS